MARRGQLKALKGKDLAKQPLNKNDKDEVDKALKELRDGKNDTLASQIERAVQEPELRAKLAESDKALDATKKSLATADKERKDGDALAQGHRLARHLWAAKIIEDGDAVKADDVKRALKTLDDAKSMLAAVDKVLKDAEVKDVGPKKLTSSHTAKQDFAEKLADTSKAA